MYEGLILLDRIQFILKKNSDVCLGHEDCKLLLEILFLLWREWHYWDSYNQINEYHFYFSFKNIFKSQTASVHNKALLINIYFP